ncbi:MAG: hypothetical protein R3E89_13290 [Thiolinea sp.]
MVRGEAEWPQEQNPPVAAATNLRFRSAWLGLVLFALCYAVVWFGLRALA